MEKLKDWEIFEQDVAEFLGGKRQVGSGNSCIAFKKGDIKCEDYLVECKFTSKETYVLNAKTWEKITSEALNAFKVPLFACRSQAGDFFLGNEIDFIELLKDEEFKILGENSRVKIKENFKMVLKGNNTSYSVICWEVNLDS